MSRILRDNIDAAPYVGERKVVGKLKLNKDAEYLDCFFNGKPNCEQIKNVTRGKTYDVVSVKGYGDCEDVTFIDDIGELQTLGSFFFDEI